LIPSTHHIFPFILLTGFDQKASIKIGENPNLERKKRESSPTSMEVRGKVDAPLPGFPLGANSRGGKGETALDLGRSNIGEDPCRGQGRGDAGRTWVWRSIDTSFSIETLIHPMHQNKWAILDPSDLQIKHVNVKMVVFR
jgi:hypothetical protein